MTHEQIIFLGLKQKIFYHIDSLSMMKNIAEMATKNSERTNEVFLPIPYFLTLVVTTEAILKAVYDCYIEMNLGANLSEKGNKFEKSNLYYKYQYIKECIFDGKESNYMSKDDWNKCSSRPIDIEDIKMFNVYLKALVKDRNAIFHVKELVTVWPLREVPRDQANYYQPLNYFPASRDVLRLKYNDDLDVLHAMYRKTITLLDFCDVGIRIMIQEKNRKSTVSLNKRKTKLNRILSFLNIN